MTEKEALKRLKQITSHLNSIRKKCRDNNLWLGAGFDALKDATDTAQQGPMITKLYKIIDENKKYLKGK